MSKQEEIIEVCGKKVVVRYTRECQPCEKCVFGESDNLCAHAKDKCVELDRVGMEIYERAYFVEAEQPEADFEAEYKRYMESRKDDVSGHAVTINIKDLARHFAEWGAEHLKK